jgi:hypothetical protein
MQTDLNELRERYIRAPHGQKRTRWRALRNATATAMMRSLERQGRFGRAS